MGTEGPSFWRRMGEGEHPCAHSIPREEGAPCTNLFCPAVVETYAIHYGHLPVQRLLLPPELLLHLASFLDCLGDSIMVI